MLALRGGIVNSEPGIALGSCFLQVNRTFQELALLKDVQEVWEVLGPQLFNFMNDSANVAILQVGPGGRAAGSYSLPGQITSCCRLGHTGQGLLGKGAEVKCGPHGGDRPQG